MFNALSYYLDYSCNTHIEVCEDIAHTSKKRFSEFSDICWSSGSQWCLDCCNALSASGAPTESSLRGEDQESGQAMGLLCAVR